MHVAVHEMRRQAMTVQDVVGFKQHSRDTWAAGDYAATGAYELWPLGERIVATLGVQPGEDVLDVACGTGNAALRAAQAGARVVGLDLTPELLEVARRGAAEAAVDVEWVEGDAEALPFADGAFDVVVSVMGVMFAPRHEVAAREIARVLRPGGRLGLTTWALEGKMGRLFASVGAFMPDGPDFAAPPPLWGDEAHVRRLFEGTGVEPAFERGTLGDRRRFAAVDEAVEFFTTRFGPLIHARAHAEAEGTWPSLREVIAESFADEEPAEYLVVLGRKAGSG